MISMGVLFVIFTTVLLIGGVAYTVLWFHQAGARLEAAPVKREASGGGRRRR